jgi:hypothetical protein
MLKLKKSVAEITNYQATYHVFGERFAIENKYHEILIPPLADIVATMLREDNSLEVYVRSSQKHAKQIISFDFKSDKVKLVKTNQYLDELKNLGIEFELVTLQEGLSLSLILDKSYDLLEGYVFELEDSTFVVESAYILENIELNNDNLIFLENSGYYLLHQGKNIPVIGQKDIVDSEQDIFHRPKYGIILSCDGDSVVMPIDKFGSFQKVIKKSAHMIGFDSLKFKSVSFLSNGKPAFVINAYNLIKLGKERELKVKKYLECYFENTKLAFRAQDVCEVVSIKLLSKSVTGTESLGLINYQGQVITVYGPQVFGTHLAHDKLYNIAVIKSGNSLAAVAIGENMSICSVDDSLVYKNHAFSTELNNQSILESYCKADNEVHVIDPQFLFAQHLKLKKVA